METELNSLIRSYARISIEICDAYKYSILPNTISAEGYTQEDTCGFVIPVSGKARFMLCNKIYYLEPGIVLHAGPGMCLDKEVLSGSNWEFVLIHYKILGPEKEKLRLEQKHFVLNTGSSPNLMKIVLKLCQNTASVENISMLRSKVLFYSMLEELFQLAHKKFYASDQEIISHALEYIHAHYEDALSVAELSELLEMDGRKFAYVFQKCVGMCPHSYLTKYRINKAKEMLIMQESTIGEIANLVGYEDSFYFSRVFKKYTGLAPSDFRNHFRKSPW